MIVGFLGAPNSGKTTVAAKVFAELKQAGQPNVEFVAEEARRYIAELKCMGIEPQLKDADQHQIFERQKLVEKTMHNAVKDGIIVSDSSALNSLWYMTDKERWSYPWNVEYVEYNKWLEQNALLFYCPIVGIQTIDSLRIHDKQAAREIDARCGGFMVAEKSWLPIKALLSGSIDMRVGKVLENVFERLQS